MALPTQLNAATMYGRMATTADGGQPVDSVAWIPAPMLYAALPNYAPPDLCAELLANGFGTEDEVLRILRTSLAKLLRAAEKGVAWAEQLGEPWSAGLGDGRVRALLAADAAGTWQAADTAEWRSYTRAPADGSPPSREWLERREALYDAAAGHLWTCDGKHGKPLYRTINDALLSVNCTATPGAAVLPDVEAAVRVAAQWPAYLHHLQRLCLRLPCEPGTVWRGISLPRDAPPFVPGRVLAHATIASTSTDKQTAVSRSGYECLGHAQPRAAVVMEIEQQTAVNIAPLSAFPEETERLLLPFTLLEVTEVVDDAGGPTAPLRYQLVRLRERRSPAQHLAQLLNHPARLEPLPESGARWVSLDPHTGQAVPYPPAVQQQLELSFGPHPLHQSAPVRFELYGERYVVEVTEDGAGRRRWVQRGEHGGSRLVDRHAPGETHLSLRAALVEEQAAHAATTLVAERAEHAATHLAEVQQTAAALPLVPERGFAQALQIADLERRLRRLMPAVRALGPELTRAELGQGIADDTYVAAVARCCPNLQYLDVTECTKLTDAALTAVAERCPQLQHLNVTRCSLLTDAALTAVAEHCPQLQHLNVSWCKKLTDTALTAVAKHCPQLLHLDVSECEQLTGAALAAIAQHCPQLQHLNVSWCTKLTDAALAAVVRHCPQLRHLNVTQCWRLSGAALLAVARHCPQLQHLNVTRCWHLTNAELAAVAEHCPQLQHLNVSECGLLTDGALLAVARHCPQLLHLKVTGCFEFTGAAYTAIARHCPQLRLLDVSGCWRLTDAELAAVVEHCPQLLHLDVSGCEKLTAAGLATLAQRCPRLGTLSG